MIEFKTYVTLRLLKNSRFSSAVATPLVDSSVNIRVEVTRAISSIARKARQSRTEGMRKLKKLGERGPRDAHLEEDAK